MKIKNTTNRVIQVPGTQPGYYFAFQPGEVRDVEDGLSGLFLQQSGLTIFRDEKSDTATLLCDKCGKQLNSKNPKFNSRVLALHKSRCKVK